jgi:hypothetical protein
MGYVQCEKIPLIAVFGISNPKNDHQNKIRDFDVTGEIGQF